MKIKLIWALALVIALGASCKKEEQPQPEKKSYRELKENKATAGIRWDLPGTGEPPVTFDPGNPLDESNWGYPNNPTTFPHNSGVCNCGQYASCHPGGYSVIWYEGVDHNGHVLLFDVKPGQVKFPEGATFFP
ncbi:hypothetical protein AY601_4075 [Pedobacter cryoconitis]|uniref:Lipoprotein n=1 Tax=Pedobacter cryoconitis TaxID=188932 RepID=A0A127VHW9_9SPHI|nr:hypothetical protein [Pedobacter cryoconitis]AMQ00926.1 hypothetical protein AY601_4075 [Pedobacter cryoconitis]